MPITILPFPTDTNKKTKGDSCDILSMLSKEARDVVQKNPHLLRYLNVLPVKEHGIPQFHTKLDKTMAMGGKHPNVIYPVKGGIFTHILHDGNDGRDTYIPIEPIFGENMDKLMIEIEKRLLDISELLNLKAIASDAERRIRILQNIDLVVTTSDRPSSFMSRLPFRSKIKPLVITPAQLRSLKYMMVRDKLGMGMLEALVQDKYVEDISCSGMGAVFIEHKIFRSLKSSVNFPDNDDLDAFVMRLAERIKKPVSVHSPIVDATLPDGSRINIVYGRDVSKRGSNFTIRKFSETPLSILEIIGGGCLDYKMAAYLSIMLQEGMNMFVCGETASGKTTTLNAVTVFIPTNAKIVSIEDTPELQVPHKNWIRETIRSTKDADAGSVTMFDLLKAALRQRPNEIIIGEIRGSEGAIAFQAMQTGHSVMATFHAASVERLIQRLTGDPINVPKSYIDNLNLVIIQSAVKVPGGQMGRRMLSISEIVGYDAAKQSYLFVEVFKWNSVTDTFDFTGENNSFLLEYKIAPKLGIPSHKARQIYALLERRAKILEKLKNQGVTNFYDLLNVLAKAQKENLF